MNNDNKLQDFSVGKSTLDNTKVGGSDYKFINYTSTPLVYAGKNQDVAAAVNKTEAERTGSYDPYMLNSKKAYDSAYNQAPKVEISNGKIVVSAPKEILNSTYYKQLAKELQTLKGADLSSPEVKNAINTLNKEIQQNFQEIAVKNTIGWSLEELNDYQHAMQTVRSTNPLKSSNLIKGKTKEGKIESKTPQQWIDYYRSAYNTNERSDAFNESLQSNDPYIRTMALVMSQGGQNPVYGFDTGERLAQGWNAFKNQMKKFPEGTFKTMFGNVDLANTIEDKMKDFKIDREATKDISVIDEATFSQKLQDLWGKKWEDLSDQDKAFVILVSYGGKEEDAGDEVDNAAARLRLEQLDGQHEGWTYAPEIQNMEPEDALARILWKASYDGYKKKRDAYLSWMGYEDNNNEDDIRLGKNASWSGVEQFAGNLSGTIGRYMWEAAVVRALTGGVSAKSLANPKLLKGVEVGGINVNAISDKIGEKIISGLNRVGISPTSAAGQNMMQFTANLIGTVPEDILQTSLDNVLTDNARDNEHLFDWENMSDNFRNNLITMALVNAGKAGWNAVKKAKLIKELKRINNLTNTKVDLDGLLADTDDVARVMNNGGKIETDGEKVFVVDTDGTTTVLKNITPEGAETIRKAYDKGTVPKIKLEESDGDSVFVVDVDGTTRKLTDVTKPADYGTPEYTARAKTSNDYKYEMREAAKDLSELEETRKKWVENDYKDESGNDVRVRDQGEYSNKEIPGTSKLEKLDAEIESTKKRIAEYDSAIRNLDGEDLGRTKATVDTPEGKVDADVPNYKFNTSDDALKVKVESTPNSVRYWVKQATDVFMNEFKKVMTEFHDKFGDVQVSDFDWVNYLARQKTPVEKIIGSVDPTTGRVVTQNMIDAMKWWSESPHTKKLRQASLKALGSRIDDYDTLGYLPHTDYDPTNLSYEEALTGMLWQKSTGASVMDEGKYVGYGGTFEDRYGTFVKNMLWDSRSKEVAAAKLLEELELEGQEITPELVKRVEKTVDDTIDIQRKVNNSRSTKVLDKALSDDSPADDIDWKALEKQRAEAAQELGLGKATHDAYDIYYGANGSKITGQAKSALGIGFDTQGNNLRKIATTDGTMYDNGAADMIYAQGNANDIVMHHVRGEQNLRESFIEYNVNRGMSRKKAEIKADKWVQRVGANVKDRNVYNVRAEVAKILYNDGSARIKRFLARADYDNFNATSKKYIDTFLFSKMQNDAITHSKTIGDRLASALTKMTSMRYKALFYGNLKNSLLQLSELNRLFVTFKLGDVTKMAAKMATDADFRARVDMYVDSIAPQTNRVDAELYNKYYGTLDGMKVESDGVSFKNVGKTIDDVALAPIEAAEAYKNRMMVAALLQEADSLEAAGKLKGYDEKIRWMRTRFERVALAADEMGRIGLASSPLARVALFLQNFQIRELGMHIYNIKDIAGMSGTIPKTIINEFKYASKVLGTKMATAVLLSRLGYSASQALGLDPFGLMNSYSQMDDDEMNWLDRQISGGVLTPFLSGGMTSLIADLYFMGRNAYEKSVRTTVSEDARENLKKDDFWDSLKFWERWKLPDDTFSWSNAMETASGFIPGSTAFKRINQMNEMMDSGWAVSQSGNKMYTAPTDVPNTILGYLFGRNATANANQYQQTFGDNLGQTLGRMMPWHNWGDFDPIDDKYYSDWFKGDDNDLQQFNKGIYYFKAQRDRILDTYEDAIRNSYDSDQIAEAKNTMNQDLNELYTQLQRFVDAYEKKNGTITPTLTKQVINTLNTGRKVLGDTADDAEQRSLEDYAEALERYSMLGMSPVGTYTGPTVDNPDKEVKYQGSPQWRAAVSGYYDSDEEAVAVLKEADKVLAPIREKLQDSLSKAYDTANKTGKYDAVTKIQKQYLKEFDNVVSPIIAAYGNSILKSTKVADQLRDMLSTGSNKKSANLIPSEQYAKNKWGRYQSMEKESVDVGKWAQERFSDKLYTNQTVMSNSTAAEDLAEIKRLIRRGQNDRARARALQLKVRVDNQTRSLPSSDYQWLESYLNSKEGK